MRTLAALLVVAVCLAPATSAASVASTEQVTITVTVVDEAGNAVGGADVTVTYGDIEKSGRTFSNGKVFFDVEEGADVTVDAEADGLALNSPKTIADVDGSTEVDLTLYPAATAAITVQDGDGEPIEGARVELQKADEPTAAVTGETAANGTFVAADIEEGDYTVRVRSEGYYRTETSLRVANRAGKTVSLEAGTVNVEFSTVDGHFEEDRPLAANVVLFEDDEQLLNLSTGSSGARSVGLDVNTQYRVVVKKPGYDDVTATFTTGESDSSVRYAINRTPSLSIAAENTQVVTGQSVRVTVTDEYDEPVEGASILVAGESVAETGADGTATVTIDADGEVNITAVTGTLEATTTVEGVEPGEDETTSEATTTATTTTEAPLTTEAPADDGEGPGSIPGFGALVAALALAVTVLALARRRGE